MRYQDYEKEGLVVCTLPVIIYDINQARTSAFAVEALRDVQPGRYKSGNVRSYSLMDKPELKSCSRKQGLVVQRRSDSEGMLVDSSIVAVSANPLTQDELEASFTFDEVEIFKLNNAAGEASMPRRLNALGWTAGYRRKVILRDAFFDEATDFERIRIGTVVCCLPVKPTYSQIRKGFYDRRGAFARVKEY